MSNDNTEKSILEKFLYDGKMVKDESQLSYAKDILREMASAMLNDELTPNTDTMSIFTSRIADIDRIISEQLNEILHAADFQRLEGTWRGLKHLVQETETGETLKLRVLNVNRKTLQSDLEKAVEFDQSKLFKKVYEEEYGTFGGSPYSVLLYDFEFGRSPVDMVLLSKLSEVAAAAHTPLLTGAGPKLFDMESFTELPNPRDLAKIFASSELIKWRSLRDAEDSRYITLCMPHILMRLPYGPDTLPVEEFNYIEDVSGKVHEKYLWANAAWALAERITTAYAKYGWTAAIRGVEGGGLVENLPTHTFKTDAGDIAIKCPTEVAITDRREKELSDLGFLPILYCKGTDRAAFFGGQTAHKPLVYNTDDANANARLSAVLPYMLNASRFAHYIKAIMRDKIGSFLTAKNVESYLNTWLANYVLLTDDAGQEVKAKFPLREARADVSEIPGKPGCYTAVVFLKPHFQLEELTASIRLVAELPQPAA